MKVPLLASLYLGLALLTPAQSLDFAGPVILGTINSEALPEASGIVTSRANPNVFWTHNDGPRNHLYAFRMDGALLADFSFIGDSLDIEDITIGPGPDTTRDYVYLGDIGSNFATRDTVTIFRIAEPTVDEAWTDTPLTQDIEATAFHLRYPDGVYDAEAIFIDPIDQKLFIATKQTGTCRLYSIALNQLIADQTQNLEFSLAISFDRVNAGDISADGSMIALRRGSRANAWIRNPGQTVVEALSTGATRIPVVGSPEEPNGEAISFLPDNTGYITLSEGLFQPIYFFRRIQPCTDSPKFTQSPVLIDNGLQLTFTACPGSTVAIDRSPDLQTWNEIATVPITTSPASHTDLQVAAPAYYRLRVVQ